MLLSLKEIRIDIQKDGIMNKANPAVSDSFNKIINIIDDVESKIAVQYPDEYKKNIKQRSFHRGILQKKRRMLRYF
uniref:hypothetical protein n=1 Tax=Escherichia coli TaxID=562 RepID=UPI001F3D0A85|nr:hypothetical protein [Escherichia coli]UGK56307.1 hypothetical protein [Escherichia coli]